MSAVTGLGGFLFLYTNESIPESEVDLSFSGAQDTTCKMQIQNLASAEPVGFSEGIWAPGSSGEIYFFCTCPRSLSGQEALVSIMDLTLHPL